MQTNFKTVAAAIFNFITVPLYAADGRILIKFGTLVQNDTL